MLALRPPSITPARSALPPWDPPTTITHDFTTLPQVESRLQRYATTSEPSWICCTRAMKSAAEDMAGAAGVNQKIGVQTAYLTPPTLAPPALNQPAGVVAGFLNVLPKLGYRLYGGGARVAIGSGGSQRRAGKSPQITG